MGKNSGVRDRYDYVESMLHKSLFSLWLRNNGMKTNRTDEATKDIICIDFQFGLRGYEEERKRLEDRAGKEKDEKKLAALHEAIKRLEANKDKCRKISKDEIRRELYVNGAPITYNDTIEYKMLYRNPSKAKEGSCMFIRKELYDKARDWLTMGLEMDPENAKIVEMSAYAPLSTSAIEGTVRFLSGEVVILKDQDSFFRTVADIVRTADENGKKKCIVEREETDVANAMWDGMALVESDALPDWCNGMALLRNHFFKACAFKCRIQLFLQDYCRENGIDYDTFEIEDMFGNKHLARNVKLITTDNAAKWMKFSNLMGDTLKEAYDYWVDRLAKDDFIYGIVKTDHPSKLGNVQQTSYQMINTLPSTAEGICAICKTSMDYVESLKDDDQEYIGYLRRNSNITNHYDMMIDLFQHNSDFCRTGWWRQDKSLVIKNYVNHLRRGKITVEGDNLTVCGNPYALLLYLVGEDWESDPTLRPEAGVIQVYTKRFKAGEYLCGIRSPQNSANNLGYFRNIHHPFMDRYFDFSCNIMAVNCIHTDVQARMNGEDFDSDFNFVTNQPDMVKAAREAYIEYPTVVNQIAESGNTYKATLDAYADMDIYMQQAQKNIGGSSDVAQLSQSYYWDKVSRGEIDEECKQYYDNTVILAVLAHWASFREI